MHQALADGQCYVINILARDQEHLSNRFATPGPKDFSDLELRKGETGAPILSGTLAYLDCKLVNTLPAGDHDLFVGEVLAGELGDGDPLLYFAGGYRGIADKDSELDKLSWLGDQKVFHKYTRSLSYLNEFITVLIPRLKLNLGFHFSLIRAFLISGYTLIFSSSLYFILPNCICPFPIIL